MSKKTVGFNKQSINQLPNDKPVVYKIQTENGKTNYAGIAQRGRVQLTTGVGPPQHAGSAEVQVK